MRKSWILPLALAVVLAAGVVAGQVGVKQYQVSHAAGQALAMTLHIGWPALAVAAWVAWAHKRTPAAVSYAAGLSVVVLMRLMGMARVPLIGGLVVSPFYPVCLALAAIWWGGRSLQRTGLLGGVLLGAVGLLTLLSWTIALSVFRSGSGGALAPALSWVDVLCWGLLAAMALSDYRTSRATSLLWLGGQAAILAVSSVAVGVLTRLTANLMSALALVMAIGVVVTSYTSAGAQFRSRSS